MGHEPLDEGEKSYAQNGISPKTLHEEILKIDFDISMVKSPFGDRQAPATKTGLRLVH